MPQPFSDLPRYLAERARTTRIAGSIPALLAHPDWVTPSPTMIWLHGRTANKELDPGRYLRWIRAGIAACAIDLPGHGERKIKGWDTPDHTLDVLEQAISEIDPIVESLAAPEFGGVFDLDRLGVGGMSAGGMVALRRLCDEHEFKAAAVECTTGWLSNLYFTSNAEEGDRNKSPIGTGTVESIRWPRHSPERVARLDPMMHLEGFRPLPLLVLHAETDRVIPIRGMMSFVEALRERYAARRALEAIEVHTWRDTSAPEEHAGFGKFGNDAKNVQVEFLSRAFGLT